VAADLAPDASETLWPPPASRTNEHIDKASEGKTNGQTQRLLLVCRGAACRAAGADTTWERCLDAYVNSRVAGRAPSCVPIEVACARRCEEAPVALIVDAGESKQGVLTEDDAQRLLRPIE
jgi:NADH:ubiquinone oxidoreductase subunit E